MTVKRMDNVGIVVQDLDAAIAFFTELGLTLEGRAPVEGDWADGVTGLRGMRVEIAMMRTPDGHSRLELSRFIAPPVVADHRVAPVNALGPIPFDRESPFELETELGEKRDSAIEGFHHDADVVHPLNRHLGGSPFFGASRALQLQAFPVLNPG